MPKVNTPENRKLALELYASYADAGRVREALASQHGVTLSERTLRTWMREDRWAEPAPAQAAPEPDPMPDDETLPIGTRLLRGLLSRKRAYEAYFNTSAQFDVKAESAYANLLKTILEVAHKTSSSHGPEDARRLANEILENEFGIRR